MNPTRTGKIARLPHEVRELLNHRLHDGETGKKLVVWLNSLPAVRAVVALEFGGRPIRAQNLSEWKQGGYLDWLALEEARVAASRIAEEAAGWDDPGGIPLTESLARWLAVRYAVATRHLATTEGAEHWRLLREMCADVVELRRGDHSARRLDLERVRDSYRERDCEMKWQRKLEAGLAALTALASSVPAAKAPLAEIIRLANEAGLASPAGPEAPASRHA
jgi:hypothetical protein